MNRAFALNYNKEIINNRSINSVIGVLFFILATTLGAYVRIPVAGSPIPITLQTFFVILSGAVLGKRLGFYSQIGYVLFCAPFIMGPTGGYLAGFAFASYLAGWMTERNNSLAQIFISFIAGSVLIYICGIIWLVSLYRMTPLSAALAGAAPFIPGDMIKVALAAIIYSKISGRSKAIFSK